MSINRSITNRVAVAALVLSAALAPLAADARVNLDITVAPPAPMVEVVPAPRVGYVWAPGYWQWRSGKHVWVAGRWLPARRGYHYEPARWVAHAGHWRFQEGHWVR